MEIVVDLLLAPPRQKFKKVKAFLRFFRFFWKIKKNPQFWFFADFWFLACSTWNIFSVNLDNDKKLNENHYHWADRPDYFHFHFKAD